MLKNRTIGITRPKAMPGSGHLVQLPSKSEIIDNQIEAVYGMIFDLGNCTS